MKQNQNPLSFEDILESLAEGVVAVDTEMNVTVYNQSAEKITEISRALVLGKPCDACFRRNPRIAEMLRKTLTDGRLFTEYDEKLFRRITGDTIPIGVTTSQVVDARGELVGAAALIRDLSGLKSLEAGSLRKERLAAKRTVAAAPIRDLSGLKSLEAGSLRKERLAYIGTFAASLAHEIRNPLSGIRGAAQLLSRKVKEPGLGEYMDVIMKEADRLNVILNDMLDFARPARLNRKPANIHQVLDSVVLLLQEGAGPNTFVKSYDPSIPDVFGDENQLKQVFLNLVKNAKEAIAENGTIYITTRAITEFHLVEGSGAGRMVSIVVSDNGCGIKIEDLERVFTPFFTTKPKGSGLGMAITLKIVKEHGGLLKIDSEPGKGTSVAVYLPVAERGAQ